MTPRDLWSRYRDGLIDDRELGFRLDVSRMNLPDDYLQSMAPPLGVAFDEMERLEAGAIANPDEDRMVGHYWLRAPDLAPEEDIRQAIRKATTDVLELVGRVRSGALRPPTAERFERQLVVGIGGSALGPQFVDQAVGGGSGSLRPAFLDNTDPDGFDRVLGELDLSRTLTIVISKSGGTPETRNGMLAAAAAYDSLGLRLGEHAIAVTQVGSKLDAFATENGFLARFPMWDWVGGRTSEMSAVGLLPAALGGIDVEAMLAGAAAMDRQTRLRDPRRNPAALLALAWHHAGDGRGRRDMVILPYKDRLALLSRYLQQLVMESLGKQTDLDGNLVHQGIAVYGNKGSTDQHAYVQQLREGVPNFFATFVQVLEDGGGPASEVEPGVTAGDYLLGFLLGTRRALHENGRPSLTIAIDSLDARSVGMLIALYERAVGLYAGLVRVNAYHQPGVEAGKKAAAAVLEVQRKVIAALSARGGSPATSDELARDAGIEEEAETVFHVLEHLAANPGRGVSARPGRDPFGTLYTLERS